MVKRSHGRGREKSGERVKLAHVQAIISGVMGAPRRTHVRKLFSWGNNFSLKYFLTIVKTKNNHIFKCLIVRPLLENLWAPLSGVDLFYWICFLINTYNYLALYITHELYVISRVRVPGVQRFPYVCHHAQLYAQPFLLKLKVPGRNYRQGTGM